MKKQLLTIAFLAVCSFSFSQNGKTLWKNASIKSDAVVAEDKRTISNPQVFELNVELLKRKLVNAPTRLANRNSGVIVAFPDSEGNQENFRIQEFSNMEPELAARYPEIKSYIGQGIEDPSARVYFSVSPLGFQSMTVRSDKSAVFIEPYTTDLSSYTAYKKSDKGPVLDSFECKLAQNAHAEIDHNSSYARPNADDGKLRNYRLAISVTGEYTAYFGGTKALALAAINNTMTRVNAIFERDFGVHMNLISTTDNVIYTAAATDPYSNASLGTLSSNVGTANGWNLQLQRTLSSVIGDSNYDIGHLFGASGGGGNAGCIGCVCRNPTVTVPIGKGSGFTSPANAIPKGDAFDVDYVAHEMGHQFGASHSFTFSTEASASQIEPGSGSTIMGYAGITGALNNVQTNSDAYFHAISVQQITYFVKSTSCQTTVDSRNSTPTASAGADYTIPKGTPFMLTGTGTDADGDQLTYAWEQMDRGNATLSRPSVTALSGPAFRSYPPTTSRVRYFPRLETIKTGATSWTWEAIPNVARTLNFRLTVRDNNPGAGANNSDDMVITVNGTAGPFSVTSQNTAVTYQAGTTQTVSWNVAGTTANGVNASTVDILLSKDGGNTYPITLLAATPNDGSQPIVIPNEPGTQNRIMVKGTNHIFFDISNVNFTITSGTVQATPPSTPSLSASGTTASSTNLSWTTASGSTAIAGYDLYQNGTLKTTVATTSLAVTGLAASTAHTFYVKAKDAAGNVSSASNTLTVTTLAPLDTTAPTAPISLAASGTTKISTTLSWNASTDNVGVTAYYIYQNGNYVGSATTRSYTLNTLTANTTYTFTVKAIDAAGNLSAASNAVSVTTLPNITADTTIPTTPTNLTASAITQTTATLTWTASTDNVGIASYSIYKDGTYLGAATTTTYNLTGLTANTSYSYTVKGKDAAGNLSLASNTVTFRTAAIGADVTPPTAPTNLTASGTTQTSTKLTWTASTDNVGVATYSVYRNGTYITGVTSTNYTVTGLTAGTSYTFTVKGKDAAQNLSAASNAVVVTTLSAPDTTAPTAPTNLTASSTTQTSTKLTWTASTDNIGVATYSVYRNGTYITGVTSTSYNVTGLTAGTSYTFTVKGKDAAQNLSAASNAVVVTTLSTADTTAPTAPTNLTASGTTQNSVKLIWNPSTDNVGVATYSVYQNGTYINAVTSPGYEVTGLSAGTSYTFTVKGKDAAQNLSAASNAIVVNTLATTAPVITTPTVTQLSTAPSSTYCTYQGNSAAAERIGRVVFATINNASSGTAAYENFRSISTDVTRATNYSITITPAWTSTQYAAGYAVFIDYNNDGDFIDAGEKVVSKAASLIAQTVTFTIPSNATLGAKNMRVVMKRDGIPNACETFSYGQVEDYTINIISTGRGIESEEMAAQESNTEQENTLNLNLDFKLYPNPVTGNELNISTVENASYRIINLLGQEISKGKVENEIVPVAKISEGTYLLEVTANGQSVVKRFIKK